GRDSPAGPGGGWEEIRSGSWRGLCEGMGGPRGGGRGYGCVGVVGGGYWFHGSTKEWRY
ncbi:hypothetical protein HK097_004443, partial [Rhizophlyctis rosea]